MGNFKVIQYLKRSLSEKHTREKQFIRANMSSRLPNDKVTNSTFVSGPADPSSLVTRNESGKDVSAQVFHGSITGQFGEGYSDPEKNSICSISMSEEIAAVRPLQHCGEKGNNWNHDEVLEMKSCTPRLSIASRRHGRQDICIGGYGTYEYIGNNSSLESPPCLMEKRTLFRQGQGPLALDRSQLLKLKNLDRDTLLAESEDRNDNLSTIQCSLSAIDRPYYETCPTAGSKMEGPNENFGLISDGLKYSHVLQESTGCIPRHSIVFPEAADEEFGWIPICYTASGDKEDENEGDCNQDTTRA